LLLDQIGVIPVEQKQILVRTAFDDATLIHDQDQVGVADGAETMGYDDLCTRELFQVLGDALFGDDVQITGGFVQ
jgi:hypothetical protein